MNILELSFTRLVLYTFPDIPVASREFHICRTIREECALPSPLFSLTGNVVLADFRQVRELTTKLNTTHPEYAIRAGDLNAMGLIDEILHFVTALYRQRVQPDVFDTALLRLNGAIGGDQTDAVLNRFTGQFPPHAVYAGTISGDTYLAGSTGAESHRALSLEELLLLALANLNPAFRPFTFLFDDSDLGQHTAYHDAMTALQEHLRSLSPFGPTGQNLWDTLRAPALASPNSLAGQLDYMRKNWGLLIRKFTTRMLTGLDVIKEENKPVFFGPGPTQAYTYNGLDEYERFSPDQDWMPKTVLLAKSTLVWLYQLSQKYDKEINQLDQIPDQELDLLAHQGFTGLWLIGLWQRSTASKTIKQWTGNPEAAASAYSLYDYDIASELGGWDALSNLRDRCWRRGIRLGSDMVPNHTGIDSRWVIEHPERFLQLPSPPYPTYHYTCGNLSGRDEVTVQIEEHYFTRTDAAVVFKRVDNQTGETQYIYHGNDGTSMPWNDTAQIDFLNPEAREAVIRTIIGVCKQFQIVRFDAAMTLAKRHIQRLWYPEPGHGGDIASRGEHAISNDEFNRRIPNEFWREVVDRCAVEAPGTLLLAEAFWMMEGYFVRTLGMHRVYNSAFMNMLKNEENAKYRATIKNTLEFDPEVLKRFVNFMNNPDEETAVVQFGTDNKYFGICTLLVTMPGLPMFGHGQIEGYAEKYGMEYRRAYRDEKPNQYLVDRHEREIFPLMKKRAVFSGSNDFCLYDFFASDGSVNENVFAYSNRAGDDCALVLYNNSYYRATGWIRRGAVAIPQKDGTFRQDDLLAALMLHNDNRCFVTFREQQSGLWYIRSSKEVAERGMFASLSGYEAQVFLDIHEHADTSDGRWATLNSRLSGKGIPNIESAIQDIFMTELYEPFMAIFAHFSHSSQELPKNLSDLTLALKHPAHNFIVTALKMALRTDKAPNDLCEEFDAYLYRLANLDEIADHIQQYEEKKEKGTKNEQPRLRIKKPTKALLHAWKITQERIPDSTPYLVGYGILSLLRSIAGTGGAGARALADQWELGRKLVEAYTGMGIPSTESWHVVNTMLAVLSRTSPETAVPVSAESVIIDNYQADDFRQIIGVNVFEDTTWFNKEAFDSALFYAPLFLILESDAAFAAIEKEKKTAKPVLTVRKNRLETIAAIVEALAKAEAVSGYRLDRLIDTVAD